MAKKKSKKSKSKIKSSNKVVKTTKSSKGKVSSSKTGKKPGNQRKTKKKTRKPITWVNKTKQKLQLTRTQDKNRYQNLISVISDYYKKAGFKFIVWFLLIISFILWALSLFIYTNKF